MSRSVFVHVGFHKTATTWFQDHVFPFHPQVRYLGKSYPGHPCPEMKDIRDLVVDCPDTDFEKSEVREKFLEILERYQLDGKETYGLSYEGLSAGDNWFGGKNFYVIDRLSEILGDFDTKIIIGLREQRSMLESMYSEFVKLGGTKSLERLLFSPYSEGDSILGKLKYAPYVEYCRNVFGEDNVHVYLLEELKDSPAQTLEKMLQFLELKPVSIDDLNRSRRNPRLSSVALPLMRFANHFFHGPLNNFSPVSYGSYAISKLLNKLDYRKEFIKDEVERDYPAAYFYKYDQIIQNKVRHLTNEFIKGMDEKFFRGNDDYQYRLNSRLKDYLADLYREPNQRLDRKIPQNLRNFNYAMPE